VNNSFVKESHRLYKWQVSMVCTIVLILLSLFSFTFTETVFAENMSSTWKNLLEKRSSLIFTESVDIGGLRIGGRGRIMFVWLDRSLIKVLHKDGDVDDSISNGLAYFYKNNKEIKKLLQKRDIFLLSYQAIKRWDFKIEDIVINGYRLTVDDILTAAHYRVLGEIPPLKEQKRLAQTMISESMLTDDDDVDDYQLHVAVPSMPKSGKVKISYGDDTVEWEIPKR
jgi:hypothetical protein